jgi:hypothetical protein
VILVGSGEDGRSAVLPRSASLRHGPSCLSSLLRVWLLFLANITTQVRDSQAPALFTGCGAWPAPRRGKPTSWPNDYPFGWTRVVPL